jgi:hypothetical protein
MNSPERVLVDIARRLTRTWASALAGEQSAAAWPHAYPLGRPSQADLEAEFPAAAGQATAWREWAAGRGVRLRTMERRVHGTI